MELLSVRGAAIALEVNASTVSRYLKDYPVLNLGSRTRPKIDVEAMRKHRALNTNPSQQRGRHAVAVPDVAMPDDAAPGEIEASAEAVVAPPPAATAAPGPNYQTAKAVRL